MEELYDYVFHYNPYTKTWNAIPRAQYTEYTNNNELDSVLKSKDFNTLVELILKGTTFVKSIK